MNGGARCIELWAAIERPEGRVVDFLLDHGVVVYPINPKALDRARERFRQSGAKSDPFDARVAAEFLRTDHGHLAPLYPSSEAAQELKYLTEDCQRLIRQADPAGESADRDAQGLLPPRLGGRRAAHGPGAGLSPGVPDPGGPSHLNEAVAAVGQGAPGERPAGGGALVPPAAAPVARAGARQPRQGADDVGVGRRPGPRRGGRRQLPAGGRRFFGRMPAAHWARTLPVGEHGLTVPTLWLGWRTPRPGGPPSGICRRRPARSPSRNAAASSRSSRSASPATSRCARSSTSWHSCRSGPANGRGRIRRPAARVIAIVMRAGPRGQVAQDRLRHVAAAGVVRRTASSRHDGPAGVRHPTGDSLTCARESVAGPRSRCSHLRAETRAPA